MFALALSGRKDVCGYRDALRIVARAAKERAWPAAGLYYPQPMMFPYAASRAFRDGGAQERPMQEAMHCLLADLMQAHKDYALSHPFKKGGFPGGGDQSEALATALGLTAMLNIGVGTARDLGMESEYHRAIEQSVHRLLVLRRKGRPHDVNTRSLIGDHVISWKAGAVFASSFRDLAQWRSEAQTTAIALEALARYALAYDTLSPSQSNPHLWLVSNRQGSQRLKIVPMLEK